MLWVVRVQKTCVILIVIKAALQYGFDKHALTSAICILS